MNIQIVKNVYEAEAITHGITFHPDDVLATVFLSKVMDEVILCRTRDIPDDIDRNKVIIYDVGGGRFDHHQRGGNGQRKNGIPYSSAGLIWKEFGMDILRGTPDPKKIFKIIYEELFCGIDETDCGKRIKLKDGEVRNLTISSLISYMCPIEGETDTAFLKACDIMNIAFESILSKAVQEMQNIPLVEEAIEASDGKILVLEKYIPWHDAVFNSKNPKAKTLQFAIFPDKEGGFRWQTIPIKLGSYIARKEVPSSWFGLKEEKYASVTGVKDAKFCHPNGFIGGAHSFGGALKLVKIAINS